MNVTPDPFAGAPDEALLIAFANGDAQAAHALTVRLLPRVVAQATRMLANAAEAEDVAQEAMIRLWRQAPEWRQGEALVTTWLYRVTANLCTDILRKRRGGVSLDQVDEPADGTPSVTEQLQTKARMQALSDALAALPERQAQAVALRHLEGLSNPEIAQIMDISVRSVESLTARGKRALADIMSGRKAELGYDDD
ncbi:RNA polymerase sigma factor [Loktanella sp. S4079]|uniref:RNA polymerase sigma factor n=1 Tax=Loktanella sp. S4079 TaxID=579483 RepID=UPI0005F9C2EF|nr:RNA polymerase sigma factor [Loktanella sp. S4079]KJZ19681.1 RNA polymerase sigma factor [Loktanella sp. S4079]